MFGSVSNAPEMSHGKKEACSTISVVTLSLPLRNISCEKVEFVAKNYSKNKFPNKDDSNGWNEET